MSDFTVDQLARFKMLEDRVHKLRSKTNRKLETIDGYSVDWFVMRDRMERLERKREAGIGLSDDEVWDLKKFRNSKLGRRDG